MSASPVVWVSAVRLSLGVASVVHAALQPRRTAMSALDAARHSGGVAMVLSLAALISVAPALAQSAAPVAVHHIHGLAVDQGEPETLLVATHTGLVRLRPKVPTNNNFVHPMHVHGGPFEIVALDGVTLAPSARYLADTINVGPGQRYDVIWTARRPGKWLVHCHIPHHTTNNNVETLGAGGLTMILDVQ